MMNINSEKMMMTMKGIKQLLFILCLGFGFPAMAQTIETTYDVFADKTKIGTLQVTRQRTQQNGVPAMAVDTNMQLNVKSSRSTYSLSSKEHALVGPQGLLTFNADYDDNGAKSHIEGRLNDGRFSGIVKAGNEQHEFLFPPLGYDPITFVITDHPKKNGPADQSLKYMNSETMEFQEEQRATAGEEQLSLAKDTYQCHVITFTSPDSRGKRWIAKDDLGAFLVKEVGSDVTGPYSFVMTSHVTGSRE